VDDTKEHPIRLSSWMTDFADLMGKHRIQDIALPGTHNSASYSIASYSKYSPDNKFLFKHKPGWPTNKITAKWSRCQTRTISEQLRDGIRYLDIRVGARGKDLLTCHGMYGVSVHDVIRQVLEFSSESPKEVIILDFNHFYGMDDEMHRLLLQLLMKDINSRLWPYASSQISLSELWNNSDIGPIIVIYHNAIVSNTVLWPGNIGPISDENCNPESSICSPWPHTHKLKELFPRLEHGLKKHKPECPQKLFVTQGILTPSGTTIRNGMLKTRFSRKNIHSSLESLAKTVNSEFTGWMEIFCNQCKVNIVILDFYHQCNLINVILQVNKAIL